MKITNRLLKQLKAAFEVKGDVFDNRFISLEINKDTIALDTAINGHGFQYDKIDCIYLERKDVINFLFEHGVFDFDTIIKNNTPVIALDIDGVVADVGKEIRKILPSWDDTNYYVKEIDFNDFDYLGLEVLDKPNFPVDYFLTARPYEYREDTISWMQRNQFDYKIIFFTDNKLSLMHRQGIDILIEDNPDTFMNVNQGGKICYLYDATYNRHIETDLRIYNLAELQEKLEL
jgi:uncharacterized HAD superfamily protein